MKLLHAKDVIVQANKAELFCRVYGEGDPIVVIHGGPGLCQDYLLPYMEKLAKSHQIIFYDQRGCGLSTGEINENTINLPSYLNDIEAIRKSLSLKKITVLGHSWGGLLATLYASAHPETTTRLILLGTVPHTSDGYRLFEQEFFKRMGPYMEEFLAISSSKEFIQGEKEALDQYYHLIFKRYCYDPEKALLINTHMSPKSAINGSKVYKILQETLLSKPYDFQKDAMQVKCPTLIIHGDVDIIPPCTAQNLHQIMEGSEFELITNCGHFPYIEEPEKLYEVLERFLNCPSKF